MSQRDKHPSMEDLVSLHRGGLPLSAVADQEREHLNGLCPDCARNWEQFLELGRDEDGGFEAAASLEQARRSSRQMQARLAGDRRVAEAEVERLLELSPELRAKTVRRAYKRYRTPAFVERLLEEARTWLSHDHREALGFLAIAEAQLPRIRREIYGHDFLDRLEVRVIAHRANTLRVAGDLRAAEALFEVIRRRVSHPSTDDYALYGELASLEASLRYDQRRLSEAASLLERAASLYRMARDGQGLAKVLVKQGMTLYLAGRPQDAIPCYEAAAAAIDPQTELRLALSARHNLVLALCAAGQPGAALEILDQARPLYHRLGDPSTLTHLVWAEGKVAAGLDDDDVALERLRAARDASIERGLDYDAALVSLDLTEVYLRRGETAEVRREAERLAQALSDRGVDREAARAARMFYEAACAEAVSLEIIARTRTVLQRRAGRPRLRR